MDVLPSAMTPPPPHILFAAKDASATPRRAGAKRGGERLRQQILERKRRVAYQRRTSRGAFSPASAALKGPRHISRANQRTVGGLVRRVVRADDRIERQRHPRRHFVARRRPSDRPRRAHVDLALRVVEWLPSEA